MFRAEIKADARGIWGHTRGLHVGIEVIGTKDLNNKDVFDVFLTRAPDSEGPVARQPVVRIHEDGDVERYNDLGILEVVQTEGSNA